MEKKINNKFYLISSVNVLTSVILTWGNFKDTLALLVVLVILVLNHLTLKKIISELTASMSEDRSNAKHALGKVLFLVFFKMALLIGVVAAIYFYRPELTLKVLLLMIFQLIIQVVSIKNNY